MGMFFKTLVAGVIAALLAGSVVYFGMPPAQTDNSVALRTHTPSTQQSLAQTQTGERWIDRFLVPKKESTRPAVKRPSADPRTGLPAENASKIRYYRLEDGEFTGIDSPPLAASLNDAVNPDASMKIMSVMEQAAMIRQPELRDRAYLDVVDFALSEDLFTPASTAMEKIKQVELRDTARSRIAINLAEKGDSVSAFALIDEVEVNELRDVMRLQVIEALIAPQLPAEAAPQKRR